MDLSRTSRTAVTLWGMRTANAIEIAATDVASAEASELRIKRQTRTGIVPCTSGESTRLTGSQRLTAAQFAGSLLRADGFRSLDRNAERREATLPRIANGMASSRGRLAPEGIAHFTATYGSCWPAVERLATAFLPQKIAHADAKDTLLTIAAQRRFTFDPADKGDAAAFTAMMRTVNPGSGRAGGRPRKLRRTFDIWGMLQGLLPCAGHSRAYLYSRPLGVPSVPTERAVEVNAKGFGTGAGKLADVAALDAFNAAVRAQA